MKTNAKKAKIHLDKVRELMSKVPPRYHDKNKQAIVNEIRKIREKLWDEKLAGNSR